MPRVCACSQLTAAEYLAWGRAQPRKHEYFFGEVFAMAGGSPYHNALAVNVAAELRGALRTRGCAVLSSDQRIAFPPEQRRPRHASSISAAMPTVRGRIAVPASANRSC